MKNIDKPSGYEPISMPTKQEIFSYIYS